MKIFISYKWENEEHNQWVETLAADLRAAGIDALLDRWEVPYGESFTEYMTSKIAEVDVVLFIMTTRSVQAVEAQKGLGGAVKFEIQMATARQIAGEKMRLVGVYREGPGPPQHMRDRRYADFRDDSKYAVSLRELIDDLRGVTKKPPLGQKKLSPTEEKIEKLKEQFRELASERTWYSYRHMDSDHEQDYSSEISHLRKGMEEIQAEIAQLGGEPPEY